MPIELSVDKPTSGMSNQEVVLTGDDLVVEYVERLVEALYLREERGVEINGLI